MDAAEEYYPIVTRRESPLWVSLVCRGGAETYYEKALGWNYSIENYRYCRLPGNPASHGGTHQIALTDSGRMGGLISEIGSIPFYREYLARCKAECEALDQHAAVVGAVDPTGLTTHEIAELFTSIVDRHLRLMPFLASFALVDARLSGEIKVATARSLGIQAVNDPLIAEWVNTVVVPSQDAAVVREARSMLAMADTATDLGLEAPFATDSTEITRMVTDHVSKYGWLGTFTFLHEPFSADDIYQRLGQMLASSDSGRLAAAEDRAARIWAESEARLADVTDTDLRSLIDIAREGLYWRFERVDAHFRSEAKWRNLQGEIASRAGLSRDQLVQCTVDEIADWLHSKVPLPDADSLAERETNGLAFYYDAGTLRWNVEAPDEERQPDLVARGNAADPGLSGETAFPGRADGVSRLVLSKLDAAGLNEGEVLVTTMTTPDMMPAIERSAAIVTEEGSLLCHAAIISRELGKPCVMNVDLVSQTLRTGDFVSVRVIRSTDWYGYFPRAR